MSNTLKPIRFSPVIKAIQRSASNQAEATRISSRFAPFKLGIFQDVFAARYQQILKYLAEGKIKDPMLEMLKTSISIYKRQLQLLASLDLDGSALLNRDWLIGRVGPNTPLLHTFMAGGKVTFTNNNLNELVVLACAERDMKYDLKQHLGDLLPAERLHRKNPSMTRPTRMATVKATQPCEIRLPGQSWHDHFPSLNKVDVFRWSNGHAYLPLDLLATETMSSYIRTFRSGQGFNGLVLFDNFQQFVHILFDQQRTFDQQPGAQLDLIKPRGNPLEDPVKVAKIRQEYEKWLKVVLANHCQTKTLVLVNSQDAQFALPYLLAHQFTILSPNKDIRSGFTLPPQHRVLMPYAQTNLNGLEIKGGNNAIIPAKDIDGSDRTCLAQLQMHMGLDGSFVILKGPAGRKLATKPRALTPDEQKLIDHFEKLAPQRVAWQNLIEGPSDGALGPIFSM